MRVLLWSGLGFIAGIIGGYIALMAGYVAYTELFRIHDQDGGGAMAMGLVVGPVVGLFCGLVLAILCGVWAARPR